MKRLLALTALLALLAGACSDRGTAADPAALTIEGRSVSVRTVEDQLAAMQEDPGIAEFLFGPGLVLEGEAPGSYSPEAGAQLLTLYAQAFLLDDLATTQGVEVTEAELAAAEEQIRQSATQVDPTTGQPVGGSSVDDLPEELLELIVGLVADQNALVAQLEAEAGTPDISDEELQAAYESVLPDATEACVSHILVAFTDDTEQLRDPSFAPSDEQVAAARAGIDEVVARLDAGEGFAAVAAEVSDDTGSGAAGGDLGCSSPSGYGPFADAVVSQPVGEIGPPVETQFGFHVIVVQQRTVPTFEELEPELRQQMEQAATDVRPAFSQLITDRAEQVEVYVDGRFGTWESVSVGVVPPQGAADAPTMPGDEPLTLPGLPG